MSTADRILEEIYQLPIVEREKVALYIVKHGIESSPREAPEPLDLEEWQDEIARKPFNLKQAADYLGISPVTLRRWIKAGRVSAYKTGRAYSFDVGELRKFKRAHNTQLEPPGEKTETIKNGSIERGDEIHKQHTRRPAG